MEWADMVNLGRAIVAQLRIDEYDTLGRWMAFRLAELLDCAAVDDSAQDAATDLILRIWRLRSDWPNGWPPITAKNQLAWLFPPDHMQSRSALSNEERLMCTVVDELTKEYRFWLRFASDHGLELTHDEETIIATEPILTQDFIRRLIALGLHDSAEPDKINVDEELESFFQTRRSLLHDALKSADGETPLDADSN